LKHFNFLFISPCEPLFPKARAIFSSLVKGPLETPPASELARYFRVRKLWESRQFAALNNEDIEFLSEATRRFASYRVQELYRAWATGDLSDARIAALFCSSNGQRQVNFDTRLMKRQRFLPSAVPG
jgi:hypothetical protein